MSEIALAQLLERLNSDDSFRNEFSNDPAAAIGNTDLSFTETMAVMAGDEDALRRLAGEQTGGYALVAFTRSGSCIGPVHQTLSGPCLQITVAGSPSYCTTCWSDNPGPKHQPC